VDGFLLTYDGFDPRTEGLREALTSTGNGYLCTRGAAEWEDADGVHYPGTYAHCARAAPRSGRTPTACTIRARTRTAATTARRR